MVKVQPTAGRARVVRNTTDGSPWMIKVQPTAARARVVRIPRTGSPWMVKVQPTTRGLSAQYCPRQSLAVGAPPRATALNSEGLLHAHAPEQTALAPFTGLVHVS
jgi:hypothetical protein